MWTLFAILLVLSTFNIANSQKTYESIEISRTTFEELKANDTQVADFGNCLNNSTSNDEENFIDCMCHKFLCVNLYCQFPEVLEDSNSCKNSNANFRKIFKDKKVMFIYDDKIQRVTFRYSKKCDWSYFKATDWYRRKRTDFFNVVTLKKYDSHFTFFYVKFCNAQKLSHRSRMATDWTETHSNYAIATNLISIIAVSLLIVVYAICWRKLPENYPAKCWLAFAVVELVDDCFIAYIQFNFETVLEQLDGYSSFGVLCVFCGYYSMELSLYMWINVLYFDIFSLVFLKKGPSSKYVFTAKRVGIYSFVGIGIPIIISILFGIFFDINTLKSGFSQRIAPKSTFDNTIFEYAKLFGGIEIGMKFICVLILIAICYMSWKTAKTDNLRDANVRRVSCALNKPRR
jgi:hypothetical protein